MIFFGRVTKSSRRRDGDEKASAEKRIRNIHCVVEIGNWLKLNI